MLPQCNLEIVEDKVPLGDVEALVKKEVKDLEAPAFLETLGQVELVPFSKIPLAKIGADLRRLVVFTPELELRFEFGAGQMFYRLLRESKGETYVYREDRLVLRVGCTKEAEWYLGGRGRVLNREYFAKDETGFYTFRADRLAGLAS